MKKLIFILFILSNPTALTFAQGIDFKQGSWADVKAEAKAQNKLIFVDFYTDWCAPCKFMTINIFPQKEAGDFYNPHFISYKINAEKGEGPAIAKEYRITGYPTLAYINYKGEVVHRVTSSMDVKDLINNGKMALTPQDDYQELKGAYEQNTLSKDDLSRYFTIVKTKGDNRETDRVFESYFAMVADVSQASYELITNNAGSTAAKSFQYLLEHLEQFQAVIGKEKVDTYLRNEFIQEFRNNAWRQVYPTTAAYMEAKQALNKKVMLTEKENIAFDADYYLAKGDEDNYMEAAAKLVDSYYVNDDFQISNLLGGSSRLVKKEANILITLKWAKQALALKDNSLNNATLALIYQKLNDKSNAMKYIELSIADSKRDGDGYVEKIEALKKDIVAMAD